MTASSRSVGAPSDAAALFADLAGIGPFFAVGTGEPPGRGWVPVGALGDPRGPLTDRIDAVGVALGTGYQKIVTGGPGETVRSSSRRRSPSSVRVAASIAFQGVAAQVVAPLFAAAAVHGALPDGPVAASLLWRPGGDGPWLWWRDGPGPVVACPGGGRLGELVTALLSPVVAAVRARVAVAERVLWGNVASSVASARRLVAAARPDAAVRSAAVARLLLTAAPLAATTILRDPAPPDVGWTFHRRSCCLYYRVPDGGTCGDCVLRRPVG